MINLKQYQVWFVTGSQHLYGPETLKQVAGHSKEIAKAYDESMVIPVQVVWKPTVKSAHEIIRIIRAANNADNCVGIIAWMHTFSPAKMWIAGLKELGKPLLHLHTQHNAGIPWKEIDMDFMNLNQSAHGGREFGFIASRMRISRKVVTGYWQSDTVIDKVADWCRVAAAVADSKRMKVARFGDNMRQVAVTEGNKVSAQIRFGYEVNGYGLGNLAERVEGVSAAEIDILLQEYADTYALADDLKNGKEHHGALRDAAQIEIALRGFMEEGNFTAFTNTFENLQGLKQLPGIAVQRLMFDGYGFGAEGDWKTAALVRTMKVMAAGLKGGNSFMEDYTYHFESENSATLGSHMLEICPSIADVKPRVEVHPLGIGGKDNPARLVFGSGNGQALNASIVDMGDRFRMLVNTVEAMEIKNDMPNLPVAHALWKPHPNLDISATAWILAGGAHHTCYSQNLHPEQLEDLADIFGIEFLLIDDSTDLYRFKQELRWNDSIFTSGS